MAVQHRERVTALVALAAVSGRFQLRAEDPADRLVMGTGLGRGLLSALARHSPEKLISATLASEGRLSKDQLADQTARVLAEPTLREFALTLGLTANHSGHRRGGYDNDCREFESISTLELGRIAAPCLLVHGQADADVPIEQSLSAAAELPQADLIEIPLGGHLGFYVDPGAAQDRALDLLRRHAG